MVTLISFGLFLLLFVGVGLYSVTRKKKHVTDYYVASRSINPIFVGLSAITSLYSGFMYFGFVGMTHKMGISFIWWPVAGFTGNLLGNLFYLEKFTKKAQGLNCSTFVQFLSKGTGTYYRYVSIVAALIVIAFLSVGCSGQLMAGAKAFNSMYSLDMWIGGLVILLVVLLYCYAGGIRASIWTDVVQSIVMMTTMLALTVYAVIECNGFSQLFNSLNEINPALTSVSMPQFGGWPLYLLAWFFVCFGCGISMPYVMVRHLTNKNIDNTKQVLTVYMSFYAVFMMCAFVVGLCAIVLLERHGIQDSEYALITVTKFLFNDVMVGVMLAGIFAGIISTADSLILVCSSAITKDLFPKLGNKYSYAKLSTLLVGVVVYLTFMYGSKSVFSIVMFSVSAMACAFAPVLILYLHGKKPKELTVVLMMVLTVTSIVVWREVGLAKIVNEGIFAFPFAFVVYFVSEGFYKLRSKKS